MKNLKTEEQSEIRVESRKRLEENQRLKKGGSKRGREGEKEECKD